MGKHGITPASQKAAKKGAKKAWKGTAPWLKKGLSRVEKVIAFIEVLPVTAGLLVGQRMQVRPWQREILEGLYRTDANGCREVRQAVLTLPRKSGKTALAAALALAHLIGPEAEPRGQVMSAASDREQASLIFREMEALILQVPEFAERCNVKAHNKEILDLETGSRYMALSRDSRKAHGLSPSFLVFDELAQSPDRELWDNLLTGTGARKEPLALAISTQSPESDHVLSEMVDYQLAIEAGTLPPDPSFYGKVYAAPDECNIWDEKVWFECNPGLDDFRSLEEMRTFAEKAKKIPGMENVFRNLYMNQRVSVKSDFVTSEAYDACVGALPDLKGRACYMGLDLASVQDLTAAVLCFEPLPGEPFYVMPFCWVPADNIGERTRKDRVPYTLWQRQGHIESTPGGVTNHQAILKKIGELKSIYDIRGVCYDRWGAVQIVNQLEAMGLPVIAMGQGMMSMSPPIKELLRLILEKSIRFPKNPVLKWCFSNVVTETDAASNVKFNKGRSTEKIDLAQATVMALDGVIRNQKERHEPKIAWM